MALYDTHQTPTLDAALSEIAQLKRAAELLERVYLHIGPYSGSISYENEAWSKVRDHFGFNDSE